MSWIQRVTGFVARLIGVERTPADSVRPEQIYREIDELAMEHLGVSGDQALEMLREGKLDGTAIEVALKLRLFLLGRDDRKVPQHSRSVPPGSRRVSHAT